MLRRARRLPAALAAAALTVSLAGCGSDPAPAFETQERLDAVSVSGDVGTAPKVEWKSRMSADEPETETLVEGDGEAVEDGDSVLAHLWIGNGFAQEEAYNTYAQQQPQTLTMNDQLPAYLSSIEGAKVGSRLAITLSAGEAFGETGNAQLGIGNQDPLLVVVDVIAAPLTGPEGAEKPAPAWAPKIQEKDGEPTGFDFAGVPKPTDQLRSAALVEGTGPVVKKGQTIVVNYLGQVFGGKTPFDESYSKEPTSFVIGEGQVVKGWDQTLVGAKVGSRILVEIPPKLGYGEKGNSQAGIKGTDTLVFVVDVLAAA